MGITNFCRLIEPFQSRLTNPGYFDSLLIDLQGYIYSGIWKVFQDERGDEEELYDDICHKVWYLVETELNHLFSFPSALPSQPVNLFLSFDGPGVPMKWPVQRERRQRAPPWSGLKDKHFYTHVLFGANVLSEKVHTHMVRRLILYAQEVHGRPMHVVVAGCHIEGEGEHKLFHLAAHPQYRDRCRHLMVMSVDQDVFMIAGFRLNQFDSVQVYRYLHFYPVTQLFRSRLPYPMERFITVSFLFGNDFFPPVVGITDTNCASLLQALRYRKDGEEDPPAILARFLRKLSTHLRFKKADSVNPLIPRTFWINTLWMRDYYRRRAFPQLYAKNKLFEVYDRAQLLTALLNEAQSRAHYREAQAEYRRIVTERPDPRDAERVFTDARYLDQLRPYWVTPSETTCHVIDIVEAVEKVSTPPR